MAFRIVIPARYGSTRLPGKPLALIGTKPLIQHVYARACESAAAEVVIATDDVRIAEVASVVGARVCMTGSHHQSGSERIAEALQQLGWPDDTCVVNVQGDEPCMPSALINQVAANLQQYQDAAMTTLAAQIRDWETAFNPNVVKVVMDANGYALYFSRAPIPWYRDIFPPPATGLICSGVDMYRHIGLYAYRAGFVQQYVSWQPSPLEQIESLEQLRVLWNGRRIHVGIAEREPGPGVDTPEDIRRAEALLACDPYH